jgi:hypothetical protein
MNTSETQLEFDFMKLNKLTFGWDKNVYFSTNALTPMLSWKPTCAVSFYKAYEKVGELDWTDGIMKFNGDADESAQLFFDNIIKRYTQSST